MDKSGSASIKTPVISQELDNSNNGTAPSKDEVAGVFSNKPVKTYDGSNTISASKPKHLPHQNQNKKRLNLDYVISERETKRKEITVDCSKQGSLEGHGGEELYFVNSLIKQQVIDQFRVNQPPLTTVCIRSPDDLVKNGLLQEVWLENSE